VPNEGTRGALRAYYNAARKSQQAQSNKPNEATSMTMTVSIGPVIALIAGVLILVMPRLLNFIVAIYLILIGLLGLFGQGGHHFI
jgi:hypothetical protein